MADNTENLNQRNFVKCPFCPCVFLTEADLHRHLDCMGHHEADHSECYRRTHGRIEHGYSSE